MLRLRLKELRDEKHISQAQLARALGVVQSTVGMWESGKSVPEYNTLLKAADYFSVSVDYLTGKTNEKDIKKPPVQTDEELLDAELIRRLCQLTPEELEKVDAFVQGLLTAR